MAAPTEIKDYLGKKVHLPHSYWGKNDAKTYYPGEELNGSRCYTLIDYQPAEGDDSESLGFDVEKDDRYRIVLQSLRTYWREKRFDEQQEGILC